MLTVIAVLYLQLYPRIWHPHAKFPRDIGTSSVIWHPQCNREYGTPMPYFLGNMHRMHNFLLINQTYENHDHYTINCLQIANRNYHKLLIYRKSTGIIITNNCLQIEITIKLPLLASPLFILSGKFIKPIYFRWNQSSQISNHVIIGLGHLAAAKEFNFSAWKVVVMIASLTQREWHLRFF